MYRSFRLPFALLAMFGLMLALASSASAVVLTGSSDDSDGDGYGNVIETKLGSNPANAKSTPESSVIRPITPVNGQFTKQYPDTCRDGVDNDLDGTSDGADSGCTNPAVSSSQFPSASGETPVAVRLVTKGLLVNAGPIGMCASDFDGIGFAVIKNDPPAGTNPDHQAIQITALQVNGTSEIIDDHPEYPDNPAPGNQSGPTPPYDPTECALPERGEALPPNDHGFISTVDVIQDPAAGFESFGSFDDANPGDAVLDFPATSSIALKTLTYPSALSATVKATGAPLVHSNVTQIPPYCTTGCNVKSTDDPFGAGADCYVGTDGKGALCIIAPEAPPVTPAVDNFKLYKTAGPSQTKANVNVKDEFDPVVGPPDSTQVTKQDTLGNPVSVNGGGTLNGDNHQRCYKAKAPKFLKRTIVSHDQFGYQQVQVKKPAELCVSAQQSPDGAPSGEDNFQCYSASSKTKLPNATIALADGFGSQTGVKLTPKPTLWCAPADVNGGGIADPDAHLSCYKISGGTPKIAPVTGLTIDPVATPDPPFATEAGVRALNGTMLCTSSLRVS